MKQISKKTLKYLYYKKEKSFKKIAKILKCSLSTIFRRFKQWNLIARKGCSLDHYKKHKKLIASYLKYLYFTKKYSTIKIARRFKTSLSLIFYYLKKFNIKMRSASEALSLAMNTQEYKNQCSKRVKGKHNPMYNRKGEISPNYSHGHYSDNPKICPDCGRKIWHVSKFCNQCYLKGKRNPMWKGGISKLPYPFHFSKELKEQIRKRDKYKCCLWGMTENKNRKKRNRNLSVHHIDYDKQNCSESNLITLCTCCHTKTNHNRNYFINFFRRNSYARNN
jgi:DNA-binding Lrp family transcriptional regulator